MKRSKQGIAILGVNANGVLFCTPSLEEAVMHSKVDPWAANRKTRRAWNKLVKKAMDKK